MRVEKWVERRGAEGSGVEGLHGGVEWEVFDANDVVSDEGGGIVVEGVKVVELGVLTLHVSYSSRSNHYVTPFNMSAYPRNLFIIFFTKVQK